MSLTVQVFCDKLMLLHKWTAVLTYLLTVLHVAFWSVQLLIDHRNGKVAYAYAWQYEKFLFAWIVSLLYILYHLSCSLYAILGIRLHDHALLAVHCAFQEEALRSILVLACPFRSPHYHHGCIASPSGMVVVLGRLGPLGRGTHLAVYLVALYQRVHWSKICGALEQAS